MIISKNKGLSLISVFVILAVYNIVAFLLPLDRGGMFWVGYSFTTAAILLTAGVGFYALGREGLRSKVYGCSLIVLAWTYLIVQLVFGLLEIFLVFIPFQYGILLNTILFGACLIGLVAVDISKDEIERIDRRNKEKVFYIKALQIEIEGMADKITDEAVKKILNELAESIRYSDPMSSQELADLENQIKSRVADLSKSVVDNDLSIIKIICKEVQQLIVERNRKCIALK